MVSASTPDDSWQIRREPRRWQATALSKWRDNGRHGIVKVVTGGGKTVFAEHCMLDFIKENPGGRILVLVPTLSLLDQWWVGLQADLGVAEQDIASYSGEGHPAEPARINLLVLNTARVWGPRLSEDARTLLVVDECHRAASRHNAFALRGEHLATLGLSATPERDSDDGLDEVLVPALGPIVYEYGYNEASRDGVISSFDLVNVQVSLSEKERADYERFSRRIAREMGRSSQVDESKLKVLLMQRAQLVGQARMRIPVAVRLIERYRGKRAIVFHERVGAAREILELLLSRGHTATIYHSGLEAAVRRDNLRQFRRGVFDVLVTCRALDEGIDVPETAVAVVASSTASSRQRIQRLGRALRPSAKKDHAVILTVYATEQERQRLAEEEHNLSEARTVVWERAQVSR